MTAVVVARPESGLTAAQLDAFCRRSLAGFKIPKEFVLQQESLPRTSNGKVQKFLLVERLGGRQIA